MNILTSFILTTFAGLSTLLGSVIIFFKNLNHKKIIPICLSFAAGVMICVSILDLLPESFILLSNYYISIIPLVICIICFLIGFSISTFLDKIIPQKINDNNLYKVGIISMIAIIIHNIPEGIATFITSTHEINLGISLSIAIALHNIPEGISIAVPIYYATRSKNKALFYTLISCLSEPLGAIIAYMFINNINEIFMGCLYSIIAGIMIQISFYELIKESIRYKERGSIISFIIGFIIMLITIILL